MPEPPTMPETKTTRRGSIKVRAAKSEPDDAIESNTGHQIGRELANLLTRAGDKWLWALVGLLLVMVGVLGERCRSLPAEAPPALRHCVNKLGEVQALEIAQCEMDLSYCKDAQKTCLDHSKALTDNGVPWFAAIKDSDFVICLDETVRDLYDRDLRALGLNRLKDASLDQIKTIRDSMRRRMEIWNPEGKTNLPLNLTVYHEILLKFKDFDKRLSAKLREMGSPEPYILETTAPKRWLPSVFPRAQDLWARLRKSGPA